MSILKISVALCTYNGEKYLQRQLDSIFNQSRLPDELVICDDASRDSTLDILKNYRDAHPDIIRLVENPQNLGYKKNFEQAISLCSGDIILLSDQDDIWMPYRVEQSISALNQHPECCYVFSDAKLIDSDDKPLGKNLWSSINFSRPKQKIFADTDLQAAVLSQKNYVTGATLAFRTDCRDLVLPIPTTDNLIHDHWIALILSLTGHYGVAIGTPLISYRIHENQQIGAGNLKKSKTPRIKRTHYQKLLSRKEFLNSLLLSANDNVINSELFKKNMNTILDHIDRRLEIVSTRSFVRRLALVARYFKYGIYKHFTSPWMRACKDLLLAKQSTIGCAGKIKH